MAGEDELFQMELNLHPNEASGLLMIGNQELLEEHGWDLGFWACLDEGEIEDCVAAIGHHRGYTDEEGWEIERLRAEASGAAGKTEDAEAITRDESTGYVYILGSHFGGKDGPLQPKRGFVARFREADVGHVTEDPTMELDVSRRSFALHCLINDALKESDLDLLPLGEQSHKALIAATIKRGEKENKKVGRPRARGRLPDQHRRRGLQGERYPPPRSPLPHNRGRAPDPGRVRRHRPPL